MLRDGRFQPFTLQPLSAKQPVRIPIRPIAQNSHDRVARPQLLRHLLGRHDIQAAARAEVQAFLI